MFSAIPTSLCPDPKGVMLTYGSTCFDFITSIVVNYHTAEQDCRIRNGSLVDVQYQKQLEFATWQISELKINSRVWLDSLRHMHNETNGKVFIHFMLP